MVIAYLAEQFQKLREMSLDGYAHLHGEQVHLVQFDFGLTLGHFFDVFLLLLIKNTETRKNIKEARNKSENKFVYLYNCNLDA